MNQPFSRKKLYFKCTLPAIQTVLRFDEQWNMTPFNTISDIFRPRGKEPSI